MQLGLSSIFTQLPEEVQFLLSNKNEDDWFSILDKNDSTGKQLVALFKCIVKKQRIKPELVRELSAILAKKLDSNSLSKSAITAYDQVQKTLQSRKRKADDAPENQPAPKKQTHDATIEISNSTNLPVELAGIVSKYAEDIPFPWKFEDVSCITLRESDPDTVNSYYESLIYNSSIAYRPKSFYQEIMTYIESSPKESLTSAFMVKFCGSDILEICDYFKKHNIPYSQRKENRIDVVIIEATTKQNAKFFISLLEIIDNFPKKYLEEIKTHINTIFKENKNLSKG